MATQEYRIVTGEESEIHDEPHVQGSRITVRFIHELVESGDVDPKQVAEKYNLDIADVYEALAYYHNNPAEMRHVEQRHRGGSEGSGPPDLRDATRYLGVIDGVSVASGRKHRTRGSPPPGELRSRCRTYRLRPRTRERHGRHLDRGSIRCKKIGSS